MADKPAFSTSIAARAAARALGDAWLDEGKAALLAVPSVVARWESDVLVNPAHPDAARILPAAPEIVHWDSRLFSR